MARAVAHHHVSRTRRRARPGVDDVFRSEPEAAAIHASTLSTLFKLKPSQTFIICDAGGGTVDCATYKLIGQLAQLEIAEMSTRSGANCGSLFLDLRFEQLVKSL